jgi:lipopolysaccharide export system permease protein
MFIYVFFLKVGEVLGAVAGVNSLVYVWIPNFIFGLLALYLYLNAKK